MRRWIITLILIIAVLSLGSYYFASAPTDTSGPVTIHVVANESLGDIAKELKDKNVVRNATTLRRIVSFFKSSKQIARGDYLFEPGTPVYKVAWQIATSHHNVAQLKITLKEGITNDQIVAMLSSQLSQFDVKAFKTDPRVKQGYLFPDTYFFFPLTTTNEVIDQLTLNFSKKVSPLQSDMKTSGTTEADVITMASLIEKEAGGKDDAPVISGILWKRLALGMPLQVDAAPITYTVKGLPNMPINNPGLASITAAVHPVASAYLFYLHDKNGMVHYATTFAEHKANINKYLR